MDDGRKEKTSFCIVDAQSVKNTDTAEEKGYDAGKKVSGIKRHIAVDTNGLPHGSCRNPRNCIKLLSYNDHYFISKLQKI